MGMKLSERETLLRMIKSHKKHKVFCSYNVAQLYCDICFYNNKREDECKYIIKYDIKKVPEEVYIEKFGYENLVEELL
jgi:hypothetical protein